MKQTIALASVGPHLIAGELSPKNPLDTPMAMFKAEEWETPSRRALIRPVLLLPLALPQADQFGVRGFATTWVGHLFPAPLCPIDAVLWIWDGGDGGDPPEFVKVYRNVVKPDPKRVSLG